MLKDLASHIPPLSSQKNRSNRPSHLKPPPERVGGLVICSIRACSASPDSTLADANSESRDLDMEPLNDPKQHFQLPADGSAHRR